MKTFKSFFLLFLLITICTTIQAQDEFYQDEKDRDSTSIDSKIDKTLLEENYSTESDYNQTNTNEGSIEYNLIEDYAETDSEFEGGEIYHDDEKKRRKNGGVAAEVAAEIFVEVLYHTLFFVAWWSQ